MQGCFRQYPEIYGSEIDTDDDDDDMTADAAADVAVPSSSSSDATDSAAPAKEQKTKSVAPPAGPHSPEKVAENRRDLGLVPENYRPEEKQGPSPEPVAESNSLVPKAAQDGR